MLTVFAPCGERAVSIHYIYIKAEPNNTIAMSEKRKLQKSRHDEYVKEQGKKVVAYFVATLLVLCVLVLVVATLC